MAAATVAVALATAVVVDAEDKMWTMHIVAPIAAAMEVDAEDKM